MTSALEIETQAVRFPSDTFTLQAFLARPAAREGMGGAGPAIPERGPAVVVIHEWWGLNDHVKEVARRFAQEGFAAIAPDLYSRLGHKVTQEVQEAARLMESLQSQWALRDLSATVRYLKTHPAVDPAAIGAAGFSMGGTFALMMACHESDLRAAVAFYGKVPPLETLDYLVCPILYHYGAKDQWVTRKEVDVLREGLAKYGKPGEVLTYQADHAFFNDTRPEVHSASDARAAWRRTVEFLREHLE